MSNITDTAFRTSLHQFFGASIMTYGDSEAAIAVILEELTKLISTDEDISKFNNDLIKPMIKSTHYIVTQRYNHLLQDSKETFQDNIPIPIKLKLDNDKKLIDLLDLYIKQL